MSDLQIFNYQSNEVRTIQKNGTAYLSLEAVARGLGFTQEKHGTEYIRWETVNGHLSELGFPNKLGKEDFIPENIFYRLAMKAKNEAAEKFQAKIADEVIPSIRRHGMYATPDTVEKMLADPDTTIKLLETIKQERAARLALEAKAEADKPKVLFADAVAASHTSILVGDLAKLLRQNGVDIGQNRLFRFLRENGYLCGKGERYNLPTQRSMDAGWFEIKETTIGNPDGSIRITRTVKVTGKGQQYFLNLFLADKAV